MKPAPFSYARARSVEHAIELLVRPDGEARLLAGGQSLMATLNMRLSAPKLLIDLNGAAGLVGIKVANGEVVGLRVAMPRIVARRTRHTAGSRERPIEEHLSTDFGLGLERLGPHARRQHERHGDERPRGAPPQTAGYFSAHALS